MLMNGYNTDKDFCVYYLLTPEQKILFVWYSKISNAMSIIHAKANPAFDKNQQFSFHIYAIYKDQRQAINGMGEFFKLYGMPELNKTVTYNRRTKVQCVETGVIYNSQYECAKLEGLNQAQLSQHLRRNPGYKTIKGHTYKNLLPTPQPRAITYP